MSRGAYNLGAFRGIGSSLINQWKVTQTFEKYRILFKDPLLGTFTGNII